MKLASRVIRFVGNVRCVSLCVFVLFEEENDDGIYCWKLNRVLFCEKNGIFLEIYFHIRCDLYERRNANLLATTMTIPMKLINCGFHEYLDKLS